MHYIEAPDYTVLSSVHQCWPKVFLGGSITNAKDWQKKLVDQIKNENCVIYNPRRATFDVNDASQADIQIHWEFLHLREANIVVFYFSEETLAPITLFELGSRLEAVANMAKYQHLHIYCEPKYARKEDVRVQTNLVIDTLNLNSNVFLYENYNSFVKGLQISIKEYNDL